MSNIFIIVIVTDKYILHVYIQELYLRLDYCCGADIGLNESWVYYSRD
jgi:hypothetical protein